MSRKCNCVLCGGSGTFTSKYTPFFNAVRDLKYTTQIQHTWKQSQHYFSCLLAGRVPIENLEPSDRFVKVVEDLGQGFKVPVVWNLKISFEFEPETLHFSELAEWYLLQGHVHFSDQGEHVITVPITVVITPQEHLNCVDYKYDFY